MIRKGKAPIVGSGKNKRSMAFTENLIQGMVLSAAKSISSGKTYWISDENPYTMNEIIDTIESIMVEKLNIKVNYGRMNLPNFVSNVAEKCDYFIQLFGLYNQKIHVLSEMNKNIACSIDKAVSDLGYSPEFSLKMGMEISLKEIYR